MQPLAQPSVCARAVGDAVCLDRRVARNRTRCLFPVECAAPDCLRVATRAQPRCGHIVPNASSRKRRDMALRPSIKSELNKAAQVPESCVIRRCPRNGRLRSSVAVSMRLRDSWRSHDPSMRRSRSPLGLIVPSRSRFIAFRPGHDNGIAFAGRAPKPLSQVPEPAASVFAFNGGCNSPCLMPYTGGVF